MVLARILPPDTPVIVAASFAAEEGLHLITDGRRSVLSPVVPPGWFRVGVRVRQPAEDAHGSVLDRG